MGVPTPDTRSSLSLRRRLLPASPGVPSRRQGHRRGPLVGPLRRRGAHLLIPETCRRLREAPCEETYDAPCTPTLGLEAVQRKVNAAFADHLPSPLCRPRKRPLRLGVDLTLLAYYGQHPWRAGDLPHSGQGRDQLVFRLRHRLLDPPWPAVHPGRDSRDGVGVAQGVLQELLAW